MNVIKYVALLTLLICSLNTNGVSSESVPTASIEISAITYAKESIDNSINELSLDRGVVDLVQRWSGKSLRANFKGLQGTGIPYGEYILRLTVPGFKTYEQALRVYQPQIFVRAGLRVTLTDDEPITLAKGTIKSVPKDATSLWVKLLPIVNNSSLMDSRVQSDGSFSFAGFDPGEYMLVVVRGTKVIYSNQMLLTGKENNIEILLSN